MVDSRCTRHIVKDASLFSSLNNVVEEKIFVVDDYALIVVGCGRNECRMGRSLLYMSYQV